jgi:hypothetical protein
MISKDADKIRDYWKPDNQVNRTNERRIRKALHDANIEEHSISYFLYLSAYKKDHKKILKALKIT